MATKSRKISSDDDEAQGYPRLSWIRAILDGREEYSVHMRAARPLEDIDKHIADLMRQYSGRADRLSVETGNILEPDKGLPRMSWGIWYRTRSDEGRAFVGVLVGTQRAEQNVELKLVATNDERQKAIQPFATDLVETEWITEIDRLGRARKRIYRPAKTTQDVTASKPISKTNLPEEMQFPDSRGTGKRREAVYKLWRRGGLSRFEMIKALEEMGFSLMNMDVLKHDLNYIRIELRKRNLA